MEQLIKLRSPTKTTSSFSLTPHLKSNYHMLTQNAEISKTYHTVITPSLEIINRSCWQARLLRNPQVWVTRVATDYVQIVVISKHLMAVPD